VVVHQPVKTEKLSEEYFVSVNGREVPVYVAQLSPYIQSVTGWDENYSFTSFESSGTVTVTVRSSQPLKAFTIRPIEQEIPVQLDGNTATFTLPRNGNFVIERNGHGRKDPLLLFANPVEVNPPKAGDPGVIFFGPGHHDAGFISLASNQTLYIAGGAVVTGAVKARGENIKIRGRGILQNEGNPYNGHNMIHLDRCRNVSIEGIILRKKSQEWTVRPDHSDGIVISNLKICGGYGDNDDGIDPVNTRNMVVEDCFIRSKDDCMAFKGIGDRTNHCENITVVRTSLWCDQFCCILLGDESSAEFMRNITFKDCHVLFMSFEGNPKKFLMMHPGDGMHMENIRFENIAIHGEGQTHNFIEMSCENNVYSQTKEVGSMKNIFLKNVTVTGLPGGYDIVIKGFDATHTIEGVTFENCSILGQPLTADSPNLHLGGFIKDIEFK
jgi:pectate lyase